MLPAGGSCLLGSINLAEFVINHAFDFESFKKAVNISIKALNEVLDEGLPKHPLQEQRDSVRNWRQCGLGIMGLADMLIKMHIVYGSKEAVELCDRIGFTMATEALKSSCELAKEYSCTYPMYNEEEVLSSEFFSAHKTDELVSMVKQYGLYNSQLLTIAPTGTLSTMLNISGGIEPIFANSYTRTTKSLHGKDVDYKVYTPIVKKYMDTHSIQEEEQLPEFFVTSESIHIDNRISMQSVWQKHIDASISSTVNLPESATVDDVKQLYLAAWKSGLKGITMFRSGCKRVAILNVDKKEEKTEANVFTSENLPRGVILSCADDLIGKKKKLQTGCGSLHVLGFFDPDDGSLQEVYLAKGSTGGCQNFMVGLSRMISLLCRAGVDIYTIKDQLDSTGACPSYAGRSVTKHDTSKGSCCPMAIGNALVQMYEEVKKSVEDDSDEELEEEPKKVIYDKCPECGGELIHEGGCDSCPSCGYSHCS